MSRSREYVPELARIQAEKEANLSAKKADSMNRLMKDLSVDRKRNPSTFADKFASDEEGDDDYDAEYNDNDVIDRSER